MVHLVLTGATGLVGSSVLAHILSLPASTSITRLSILSRSPVPLASKPDRTNTTTQIEVINHTDYNSYPPDLLAKLKGAKGVIWAQGISQNEVDKATYVKITKDYPIAAARAFSGLNDGNFNFVYVSGEGVTHTPGHFTPIFGRVKGETELDLLNLANGDPKLTSIIARPGGVDGQKQPEIWDPIVARRSMFWKASMMVMLPVFRALSQNMMSPTTELGKALTELAMREEMTPFTGAGVEAEKGTQGDGWILRNKALRRLGGLPI